MGGSGSGRPQIRYLKLTEGQACYGGASVQEIEFVRYLKDVCNLAERTVGSRISNCRRVERYEGDLDDHFQADGMASLLRNLTYSTEDANRNLPARHHIPIVGNVRNGTATLKQAVGLYQQFRQSAGHRPETRRASSRPEPSRRKPGTAWPDWPQPDENDVLQLATVITPLVRFLHPQIVQRIVDDNGLNRSAWSTELERLGIDPDIYLWEGSPCAFPGVRRHAGSQEIAQFRKQASDSPERPADCLSLDDNDYPKHLWAYVFTGKPFRKQGPQGYQLAHLADHKAHNNRWREEFAAEPSNSPSNPPALFGLYTSPSNLAYIPSNFLKPTDFSGTLRALLLSRAYQLYGGVARLAPPPLVQRTEPNSKWHPDNFHWGECVGTVEHVDAFLQYRNQVMEELIRGSE